MLRGPEQRSERPNGNGLLQQHPEYVIYARAVKVYAGEREKKGFPITTEYAKILFVRALIAAFPTETLTKTLHTSSQALAMAVYKVPEDDFQQFSIVLRKVQKKEKKLKRKQLLKILTEREETLLDKLRKNKKPRLQEEVEVFKRKLPKTGKVIQEIYKSMYLSKRTTLDHLKILAEIEWGRREGLTTSEIAHIIDKPFYTIQAYASELVQARRIPRLPSISTPSEESRERRLQFKTMLQEHNAQHPDTKPPFTKWAKILGISRARVSQMYYEENQPTHSP